MKSLLTVCAIVLTTSGAHASLLVSNYFQSRITRFHDNSGLPQGVFAGLGEGVRTPLGMTIGPDGIVYVVMSDITTAPETIGRFDLAGHPLGTFITFGNDKFPSRLLFGPDGNLYVSFFSSGNPVRRYSAVDGSLLGDAAIGGSPGSAAGMAFGPDGNLYVTNYTNGTVRRFQGSTGVYLGAFGAGSGLAQPTGMTFGADGLLYVASRGTDQVKRFNAVTGAYLGNFAQGGGLDEPEDIVFGPDGNLYVASFKTFQVKRYSGATGAFIDDFVPVAGQYPGGLLFIPGNLPEPSSSALFMLAIAGIGLACARRRQA